MAIDFACLSSLVFLQVYTTLIGQKRQFLKVKKFEGLKNVSLIYFQPISNYSFMNGFTFSD